MPLESEKLSTVFLQLITMVGFWKALFGFFVFAVIFIGVYILIKWINWFVNRKDELEKKNQTEKQQKVLDEVILSNAEYINQVKNMVDLFNRMSDVFTKIEAKLTVSLSVRKFMVLLDAFMGLNRDFISSIKQKIFDFIESDRKDSFFYIQQEVKNTFYEKVLNRLKEFVFVDSRLEEQIQGIIIFRIEEFLNKIQEIVIQNRDSDLSRVKSEINNMILELIQELDTRLIDMYKDMVLLDKEIYFVKGLDKEC